LGSDREKQYDKAYGKSRKTLNRGKKEAKDTMFSHVSALFAAENR